MGLMGLTRTQNAVIFAAPFTIALAMTPGRRIGLFWFRLAARKSCWHCRGDTKRASIKRGACNASGDGALTW
jgi:hypothetical protein